MIKSVGKAAAAALVLFAAAQVGLGSSYLVTGGGAGSSKLIVTAKLMLDGTALEMQKNWPGDVASLGEHGWPAQIFDLHVTDAKGHSLAYTAGGPAGWTLNAPYKGELTLTYTVDYSAARAAGWPAAREDAFADATHFSVSGRSLFITTRQSGAVSVKFDLPKGWSAVAPWPARGRDRFVAAATEDLVDNLIVLTSGPVDAVSAGGFMVTVVPMGKWESVRQLLKTTIGRVIKFYVSVMGRQRGQYSVVLLPGSDAGGESYRNSFAMNIEDLPGKANSPIWAHTIAHEIFHYWNGWRLKGADYQSSQWFQEGFTDYAADLAMVRSGSVSRADLLGQIANNIEKYRKLTTALDAPGNRKGPPLYAAGSLTALCWDIRLRLLTHDGRSFADLMQTLWQATGRGRRQYGWQDIKSALERTAPADWESFYQRYIHGTEKLPVQECLSLAGLIIKKNADGSARVYVDTAATVEQRSILRGLSGIQ